VSPIAFRYCWTVSPSNDKTKGRDRNRSAIKADARLCANLTMKNRPDLLRPKERKKGD